MAVPPTLSVLLPVRDGGGLLEEALASLQFQTLEAFELLVVDDGSTDETREILTEAAREDRRIRVFSQKPLGIVAALEKARQHARGRYLARMDADDVSLPRRFEAQIELMESDHRLMASGTQVRYFPRQEVRGGALRYERWLNSLSSHEEMVRGLFVECPIPHPTLVVRSDVIDLLGGYRDVGWPEDYDLLFRLWEGGGRLGKVQETLLRWREGPDRLSRTHPAYSKEAFRRCKVHYLLRSHLAQGRGAVIWGAGPVGKAFARELLAQGGKLEAFVDLSPRKHGQEVYGVRVFPPRDAGLFPSEFHLAAVAQPGGREEIRASLRALGKREVADFVAVA